MAEFRSVGPRQRIVGFGSVTGGDVPDGEPATGDQHPACFAVQAGLVGHVHLNVLAEHDVEAGIGERQVGDVCLPNGDPLVQPDEPVEPAGCFAVFLGQVDGGDPVAAWSAT